MHGITVFRNNKCEIKLSLLAKLEIPLCKLSMYEKSLGRYSSEGTEVVILLLYPAQYLSSDHTSPKFTNTQRGKTPTPILVHLELF